jgi:hypothetical protein
MWGAGLSATSIDLDAAPRASDGLCLRLFGELNALSASERRAGWKCKSGKDVDRISPFIE